MLTLRNSPFAQSTQKGARVARRELLQWVCRCFGVAFSGSVSVPCNENDPRPDPAPNQGALCVPANDNHETRVQSRGDCELGSPLALS
jgi:hypothetical protein